MANNFYRTHQVKPFVLATLSISVLFSMHAVAITPETSETSSQNTDSDEPHADFGTLALQSQAYRTTATKTALDPDETPMSYSRIDQKTLQQRQADSVASALRYEPGISTENRGTVSIFDEYMIRGFKNYSNFYDGMRLPYDGTWNLMPQVDAYATEAVEVLKGPASALYGYNEPGGMVNQIAKVPKATQENEVKLRVGTQKLAELAVDSTGPLSDTVNYRMVALARQKDGQMQTTEEKRVLLNPSVSWQANDKVSVLANIYYQDDPNMLPSTTLPAIGTVYAASYGKLDANAYAGDKWNNFSKKVFMPSETINWQINDKLKFKHSLRYTDADAFQKNTYQKPDRPTAGLSIFENGSDRLLRRTAYTTDETMKNWATDNQLAYQLFTDKTSHNLLFGVDYQHSKSRAKYNDAWYQGVPSIDLANPNFDLLSKQSLDLTGYQQDDKIKQNQLGVYLQDEIQQGNVTIVAGLRHDKYKSTTDTKSTYGDSITVNKANETSGRIAGLYNFSNGISPYISYSQSFQPLFGINYQTGKPLEPMTANQFEGGLKYTSTDKKTSATFALYDITRKNEVSSSTDWMQVSQVGEAESKGFELSANHSFSDKLSLGLGYGLVDAKVTKDKYKPELVGKRRPQVDKHTASLWANITPTDKASINVGVRYHAGMPIDDENSDTLPSVTLVDLAGQYQIYDTYNVGLNISNLLDKQYVGTCASKDFCWMGTERQMSVSLSAKF